MSDSPVEFAAQSIADGIPWCGGVSLKFAQAAAWKIFKISVSPDDLARAGLTVTPGSCVYRCAKTGKYFADRLVITTKRAEEFLNLDLVERSLLIDNSREILMQDLVNDR